MKLLLDFLLLRLRLVVLFPGFLSFIVDLDCFYRIFLVFLVGLEKVLGNWGIFIDFLAILHFFLLDCVFLFVNLLNLYQNLIIFTPNLWYVIFKFLNSQKDFYFFLRDFHYLLRNFQAFQINFNFLFQNHQVFTINCYFLPLNFLIHSKDLNLFFLTLFPFSNFLFQLLGVFIVILLNLFYFYQYYLIGFCFYFLNLLFFIVVTRYFFLHFLIFLRDFWLFFPDFLVFPLNLDIFFEFFLDFLINLSVFYPNYRISLINYYFLLSKLPFPSYVPIKAKPFPFKRQIWILHSLLLIFKTILYHIPYPQSVPLHSFSL